MPFGALTNLGVPHLNIFLDYIYRYVIIVLSLKGRKAVARW